MKIRSYIHTFFTAGLLTAAIVPAVFGQAEPVVEVPMKYRGSMPAVEVFVNGKGPFLFAIDTGGQGQARADVSLVGTLGLKKVDEVLAGDGSATRSR